MRQGATHIAGAEAAIAVIVEDINDPQTRETRQYDLGQLTMSMMLAATDLGIGSATRPRGIKTWLVESLIHRRSDLRLVDRIGIPGTDP